MNTPDHERKPTDLAAIRLVMIEDDTLVSDLLSLAFRNRLQVQDVCVFSSGREGLAYCQEHCPDLLLVDLGLPDLNGRQIIRALRAHWPELRIIVLTGEFSARLPGELLALGVAGFVHKTCRFEEMEQAVRRVLADGMHFSAGMKPGAAITHSPRNSTSTMKPSVLTEREREIARLVASGLISKEVATQLDLSPRTVEKIRARVLAKLGLRDLSSLVRWCVEHGLV